MHCRMNACLLATMLLMIACADATGPATGTVLLRVQTSADAELDALTVVVDEGTRVQLSRSPRTTVLTLAAGLHTLRIENVPSQCTHHVNQPSSVTVPARGRIQVTFMLVCNGVAFPEYPPGGDPSCRGCWDYIARFHAAGRQAGSRERDVR